MRSKKAIADWCRVGGCRLQGEVRYIKVELQRPNTPHPKASSAYPNKLDLGLKVLGLGRTLYLWGRIIECRFPSDLTGEG